MLQKLIMLAGLLVVGACQSAPAPGDRGPSQPAVLNSYRAETLRDQCIDHVGGSSNYQASVAVRPDWLRRECTKWAEEEVRKRYGQPSP